MSTCMWVQSLSCLTFVTDSWRWEQGPELTQYVVFTMYSSGAFELHNEQQR